MAFWKFSDRVKDKVQSFTDQKFEDYRGQVSVDLARGIATAAGLVALWTAIVLVLLFGNIALGFFLAWLIRPWCGDLSYALSFGGIALVFCGLCYWVIRYRFKYIEMPVFRLISHALRSKKEP
jgi:hypothetical protein